MVRIEPNKNDNSILKSDNLTEIDKIEYKKFLSKDINVAELQNSISELLYYLNKHYGKKVMLFIDERIFKSC